MTCPKCGEVLPENATTCSFCGEAVNPVPQSTFNDPNPQPDYNNPVEEKHENVAAGVVGALIGTLIGGVAIVLLLMAEIVAGLSGLIMAICALKGYEILAGKLSKKGIMISIVFMLIIPVIAYFLGAAIVVFNELKDYGVTFAESLETLLMVVREDPETKGAVLKDLLLLYGFTALGAYGTIRTAFKKKS